MRIKCLSLWHPHAWAMYQGVKQFETRSKEFIDLPGVRGYRGPLAIHSAKKKFDPLDYHPTLCRQLAKDGLKTPESLVYGAVLCVVDLIKIHRTEDVRGRLSERERLYGDYSDGRFALETTNLRQFPVPELVTGHQGLFYRNIAPNLWRTLSLFPCEAKMKFWDDHGRYLAKVTAPCMNAGVKWQMKGGLAPLPVYLCSHHYLQAKAEHPGVEFEYVPSKEAA